MSKKKRNKNYIPKPRYNPVLLSRRVEKDHEEVSRLANFFKSYDQAYSNHITFLGNFSRHDIKNAIQSIDSILTNIEPGEFDESIIEALSAHLSVIRNTNDNFAQLIPYSTDGTFTLDTLLNASRLLFRADMDKNDIIIEYDYPTDSVLHIKLPFQSIVQIINNLLINCIKSVENNSIKHILVKGKIDIDKFVIEVHDNGTLIDTSIENQIFNYGFSTTGGSGVGLYHAKCMCENFKGKIGLSNSTHLPYNKAFILTIPLDQA